jgi:hypothetical protein
MLLLSTTLTAQNLLQFKVARELSNFYWNGFLNYYFSKGSSELLLVERFSEMIIRTDRKFIRDDNDFRFRFYTGISRFKLGFAFNSVSFADDKLSGLSKASSNEFLFGGKVYPSSKFALYAMAGYKLDYQLGQKDKGWTYMISSDTADFMISDYRLKANLRHSEDFITPRKNISSILNFAVMRKFTSNTESKVEFFVKRIKHDFYFYADSNLQRMYNVNFNIDGRDEKVISGQAILAYPIFENFYLNLGFSVSGRNIAKQIRYKTQSLYDTNIEESVLNTDIGLSYESEKIRMSLRINYVERNEVHTPQRHQLISEQLFFRAKQIEEQKNNKSLRKIINGEISLNLSNRTTLGGIFYLSLFRYDTPSSLNDDDRDELLQILRFFLRIKMSREIEIEVPLDLNNQHLVYIFSTRSVNNNWNKIIKLSPSITFENSRVKNKARFSVLANYTIYDFESQVSVVKSYIFRQFYLSDSISFPIFDRISFDGNFQLIFSESGRLRWKEFKERPIIFISTREYSFKLNYSLNDRAKFSLGYHLFEERRFRFVELSKVPDSRIVASGPTCGIEIENKKFKLSCDGWVERLRFGERVSEIPNLNLNLVFNL